MYNLYHSLQINKDYVINVDQLSHQLAESDFNGRNNPKNGWINQRASPQGK